MRVLATTAAVLVLAGLAPAAACAAPCDPLCQQRENACRGRASTAHLTRCRRGRPAR